MQLRGGHHSRVMSADPWTSSWYEQSRHRAMAQRLCLGCGMMVMRCAVRSLITPRFDRWNAHSHALLVNEIDQRLRCVVPLVAVVAMGCEALM